MVAKKLRKRKNSLKFELIINHKRTDMHTEEYPHRHHRDHDESEERKLLTKVVKAGRRTYFMDVRATQKNDYYITVTESRKNTLNDGSVNYDRHKIFLYKEDFDKFAENLMAAIDFIKHEKPEFFTEEARHKAREAREAHEAHEAHEVEP